MFFLVIRVRVVSKAKQEQWPPKPGKVPPPPPSPETPTRKPTDSEPTEPVTDKSNEVEPSAEEVSTTLSPKPSGPVETPLRAGRNPPSLPPLPSVRGARYLSLRKVRRARGLSASVGLSHGGLFRRYSTFKVRYQEVVIKRVMKGEKLMESLDGIVRNQRKRIVRARIYVSSIELKPGRAYLLMGKVIKNRLWLSGCNLHTEWDHLTIAQRGALKKYYQQNCGCRVQFCYYTDCQKIQIPGGCMWRPRTLPPSTDCGVKHRYCKKKNGECVWVNGKNYDRCVRDLWPF